MPNQFEGLESSFAVTAAPPISPSSPGENQQRWSDFCIQWIDRHRWALFALLLLAMALAFNRRWQMEPDSALYLSVGRNLALGRGYTYHGQPHALAYPGLPFALSLIFRCTHSDSQAVAAADTLMLLCGLATLGLTYRLLHLTSDRATAVLITLGVGSAREFFRYCFQIMTDVPFLMGVMAFLAGFEAVFHPRAGQQQLRRRWYDWVLLLGGLVVAVATRPTMVGLLLVAAAVLLVATLRGRLPAGWAAVGIILIAVTASVFWLVDPRGDATAGEPPTYEQQIIDRLHAGHELLQTAVGNLKLLPHSFVVSFYGMGLGPWPVEALLGAIPLVLGLWLIRLRLEWGLWIAVTLAMNILIEVHDRYFLQVLPLLLLGWWIGIRKLNHRFNRRLGNALFLPLLLLGAGPNICQVGNIIWQQNRRPFLEYYKTGKYSPYVDLAHALPQWVGPRDWVVCPVKMGRVMSFLSDRNVIEPDEVTAEIRHSAQLFVIYDPGDPEAGDFLKSLDRWRLQWEPAPLRSAARMPSHSAPHPPPVDLYRIVKTP